MKVGGKMTVDEMCLLLHGWRDSRSRLRVLLRSPCLPPGEEDWRVVVSAFCTVFDARGGRAAFWVESTEEKSALDFRLRECRCGFVDHPPEDPGLPVVGKVESTIVAVCPDFELFVMLLRD